MSKDVEAFVAEHVCVCVCVQYPNLKCSPYQNNTEQHDSHINNTVFGVSNNIRL